MHWTHINIRLVAKRSQKTHNPIAEETNGTILHPTPPKTNMSPEKGLFQYYIFQPLIFRGHVSFGVYLPDPWIRPQDIPPSSWPSIKHQHLLLGWQVLLPCPNVRSSTKSFGSAVDGGSNYGDQVSESFILHWQRWRCITNTFENAYFFAIKEKHLYHAHVYLYVIVLPFKKRMQNVTPSSDPSVTDDINLRDLQVDLEEAKQQNGNIQAMACCRHRRDILKSYWIHVANPFAIKRGINMHQLIKILSAWDVFFTHIHHWNDGSDGSCPEGCQWTNPRHEGKWSGESGE